MKVASPVDICVECFADITEADEMLPDYPGLYQCPVCGHPNGDVHDEPDVPHETPKLAVKFSAKVSGVKKEYTPANRVCEKCLEVLYEEDFIEEDNAYQCNKCGHLNEKTD